MRLEKILVFIIFIGFLAAGGIFSLGYSSQRVEEATSSSLEKSTRRVYYLPTERSFNVRALFSRIFPETITPESLKAKYLNSKIHLLLVPGHDNVNFGTQFGGTKEADLNIKVAAALFELFKEDEHFKVTTARDFKTGEYIGNLSNYFSQQRNSILSFMDERRQTMTSLLDQGAVEKNVTIKHNLAPGDASFRLYGMNKWANENGVDVSIHLHFNDDPARRGRYPGQYSGLAIYVPEKQYSNAWASKDLALSLLGELKQYFPLSNNPLEKNTIIEAQELIALGSNASQEGASLLLEYGYIYESRFRSSQIRDKVIAELAFQTYAGIKKYFDPDNPKVGFKTSFLPYNFKNNLKTGLRDSVDVLALQAALREQKLYPPQNKNSNDCPINGNFGPCTKEAVALFQEKYSEDILSPAGLSSATGFVGPRTIDKLNQLYSGY